MKLTGIKQTATYKHQNLNFSGNLIQNKELSRLQNLDSYSWERFEKSDYMKLLNSDLCKGTYSIEEVNRSFCPGYDPSTSVYYGFFRDGKECSGKRAIIIHDRYGVSSKLEEFIDTCKDAIVKDILETISK